MQNGNKIKFGRNKVVYTIVAAVLLLVFFFMMLSYAYKNSEEDGFEDLHFQTREVREDLNTQLISDRENLLTMASFAAKLHSDGESYDLLLKSFESIGLIEDIGILLPDNVFVTRVGELDVSEQINFAEEVKRGAYISGRVSDLTNPEKHVVRSAVPIVVENETVAMIYGVMNLETLEKRALENIPVEGSQVFIFDRETGDFIVDTVSEKLNNFSMLESREFLEGYSYEHMRDMNFIGKEGYAAFVSQVFKGETLYMHYAPLDCANWQIMIAEPEVAVFKEARATGKILASIFVGIVLLMSLYLVLIFYSERKESVIHLCASKVRKLLLEINQQSESINDALENIARFSYARSAFFVDTDGEDYNYIMPSAKKVFLKGEDRAYFISRLLNYAGKITRNSGVAVNIFRIVADTYLKDEEPELYEFLTDHGIKNVAFAGITNKNNHTSVLGVINPGKQGVVQMLLNDIAICFSMAIYNKKYLNKTEAIAATDSLTGLSNRMAYKKDMSYFDSKHSEDFSCIYIDVNELHVINNKYGHTAGDGMLLFIANSLKEVFAESRIYRIGGDEFLVFSEKMPQNVLKQAIDLLKNKVEEMNYHISVGMAFCSRNVDTESLVFDAEKRMYEEKARYYQQKEQRTATEIADNDVDWISTGVRELDALLSILSRRYHGVYCVSLESGMARRILMPAYLNKFSEEKDTFKDAFTYYVREMVHPDYQRAILAFLNYDAIRRQLLAGEIPSIGYSKVNGSRVVLSVYPLSENDMTETMWVFENQN